MNRKTRKLAVAFALPACLIVAASAYANAGVGKSDMNGVAKAVKSDGSLKQRAVGHLQLKNHIVSCEKLTWDLKNALCKGAFAVAGVNGAAGVNGVDGKNGADGAAGVNGVDGKNGADGAAGVNGQDGAPGAAGKDGKDGVNAQALPYGLVNVNVARGTGASTTWAQYSTTLGSPVGDQAGGTFRFTCSTDKVTCVIKVAASVTAGSKKAYPRLLIYKSDINTGQIQGQCEYFDGPFTNVTTAESTLPMSAGSSFDCGAAETQSNAPSSDLQVTSYVVGPGYYDVTTTVAFS